MRAVMAGVLVISIISLLIVLFRRPGAIRYTSLFLLHGVAAIVLLFVVNSSGVLYGITVPTNLATIITVGALGIPGLVTIICLKMVWF